MANRKKKSDNDFHPIRSVFLHGIPNKEKADFLVSLQRNYTNEVNRFIALINDHPELSVCIIKNDHKDPEIRRFEKENRSDLLGSALSQSAFDMAVDHLHNRLKTIKNEVYGLCPCGLTSSDVLFGMLLANASKDEMIIALQTIADSVKDGSFYKARIKEIETNKEFEEICNEVCGLFKIISDKHKIPTFKNVEVRAVSTVYSLEKSNNIEAPYVLEIIDPSNHGNRIAVPLNLSKDAERRLEQYKKAGTINVSMKRNGKLKVTVSFKKNPTFKNIDLENPNPNKLKVIGVDVGITDMLHTSENNVYGSFSPCQQYYHDVVEPLLGSINSLRNKKQKILYFLKKHRQSLKPDIVHALLNKVNVLDTMIRKAKAPTHKLNTYDDMQTKAIKSSVEEYIASLKGDKSIVTALELLDIRDIEKGKKSARYNQKLSNFARGMLSKKIMDELNWHGYQFVQVNPAYTSQTCPVCGYVSRDNRNFKHFVCQCCGHEDDADHVGALNIKSRVFDSDIAAIAEKQKYNSTKRNDQIKNLLLLRHFTKDDNVHFYQTDSIDKFMACHRLAMDIWM